MLIEHDELCSLIPHAGDMCLLAGVEAWDEQHIRCAVNSHRAADNPLRSNGQLAAMHGIEYAAQCMAVHGGLLARQRGETNPPGFLVAVREVAFHVDRLDDIEATLQITATEMMRSGGSFIYTFEIGADDRLLLAGRLTVMVQEEG